jgi:hypothetical protein
MQRHIVTGPVAGVQVQYSDGKTDYYPMESYNPCRIETRGIVQVVTVHGWFARLIGHYDGSWLYGQRRSELEAVVSEVKV